MTQDSNSNSGEDVQLKQEICNELGLLFGHSFDEAMTVYEQYRAKNSWHNDDAFAHEGPFGMALRMQYDVVLELDMNREEFLEWRKSFADIWKSRIG